MNGGADGQALLESARLLWEARSDFRRDRLRNKRYTYGRQWDDLIEVDGRMVTEAEYIRRQGNIPLKNNLIRRLVRSVLGVFRTRARMAVCRADDPEDTGRAEALTQLLRANGRTNRMDELYARTMEEYLISGFVAHRKWYGRRNGRTDCWTDCVDPDSFFMDTSSRDFRAWDLKAVGQLHDMTPDDLEAAFAGDGISASELRDLYAVCGDPLWAPQWGAGDGAKSFLTPSAPGMCRVIELWRRERVTLHVCHDTSDGSCRTVGTSEYEQCVRPENRRRRRAGEAPIEHTRVPSYRWRYYYLAPTGRVLRSGDSPYGEAGHPYVVKAYPYVDGEIHSFVADVIDQQRYTNRLITLYDWVMRASAKGVLLFPEDALPADGDMAEVADQWSRFNGVIMYRPVPGQPLPQQISGKTGNLGIGELLNIQMRMLEDVSGVNAALQGRADTGAVSGTLFSQQTQNSLTALLDILESFDSFMLDAACRDADNLLRFRMGGASLSYSVELV